MQHSLHIQYGSEMQDVHRVLHLGAEMEAAFYAHPVLVWRSQATTQSTDASTEQYDGPCPSCQKEEHDDRSAILRLILCSVPIIL